MLVGAFCAGGVPGVGTGFFFPPLLVGLGDGAVLCEGCWVGLMQCLPCRLMAQVRAAVTGRSTPVSSSTSSSHPTPPPPRTGEAAVLLPGGVGSRVTAPDWPFAVTVGRRETSTI